MNNYHIPVLLQEVLTYLQIKSGGSYIDGTLGGGGHTLEILKHGGRVLGIDVDQDALSHVKLRIEKEELRIRQNLTLAKGNFQNITDIAKEHGFESVDGILLDLGVSSHQLDEPTRGFSFSDGPLDMRMDNTLSVKASDLINGLTEDELIELFERLGEERFARKIAKAIVQQRRVAPFTTTQELGDLIKRSIFRSGVDIHPATRVFQALRIAVNDELNVLRTGLPKALSLLRPGGRLVVISFHSLEDRIVKQSFLEFEEQNKGRIITKKVVIPTSEEVLQNKRSRSAKLRVIEKI